MGPLGTWALALFAGHIVLLAFPAIPPEVMKGSLWSYLLATAAVVLGVLEFRRHRDLPGRIWRGWGTKTRVLVGAGGTALAFAASMVLRWITPETFHRWSQPEGVFEPITMLVYLVAAMVLHHESRALDPARLRHFRFLALGFVLLFLEEIDYFSVFGGLIGRINGVYLGSIHDLVNVALHGHFTLWMGILGSAVLVGVLWGFIATGYLQPRRLARTLVSPAGGWFLAGAVVILLAQIEDVGLFYFFGEPDTEELLEMAASWLWFCFALEVVRREGAPPGARESG